MKQILLHLTYKKLMKQVEHVQGRKEGIYLLHKADSIRKKLQKFESYDYRKVS